MKKIIFLIVILFSMLFVLLASEHDITGYSDEIRFDDKNNRLMGTLYLPKKDKPYPVIIFVHGDGAQNRLGGGGYNVLINLFLKKSIGVFSYDKAGVGASTGNWLHQSMDDRAREVLKAVKVLRQREDVIKDKIGVLGFSQAGWVIPKIAKKEYGIAYAVIVGGAINWMQQKDFYEKNQVKYLGEIPQKILQKDRSIFIKLNKDSDATKDLKLVDIPMLGIFGRDDLYVDANLSYKIYSDIFATKKDSKVVLISNATHEMLKADVYTSFYPTSSLWNQIKFFIEAENAFNPTYITLLTQWVKNKSK